MKKIISLLLFIVLIFLLFAACSSNNSYETTTTTVTTTTATTKPTTSTTETKKQYYYPTVDEYMELFDSKFAQYINYTKNTDFSTNSVSISWTVDYSSAMSMSYSASLYLNDDNRVTWCSVTTYHEKFFNCYKDLLNSQSQYDVLVETILPSYLLACLHYGKEYDNEEFGDLVVEVTKDAIVNGRTYDGKAIDCEYYVKIDEESGIISMLDYGGDTHN